MYGLAVPDYRCCCCCCSQLVTGLQQASLQGPTKHAVGAALQHVLVKMWLRGDSSTSGWLEPGTWEIWIQISSQSKKYLLCELTACGCWKLYTICVAPRLYK